MQSRDPCVTTTVEQLGTGTSNIITTVATGITSLVTKNKRFQKTTILLIGVQIINDIATNQLIITFQKHLYDPAILRDEPRVTQGTTKEPNFYCQNKKVIKKIDDLISRGP